MSTVLNDWIATQPDGSTIVFPAGSTYQLSQGIQLGQRHNLTFIGNGATLRTTGAGTDQLASLFVLGHKWRSNWTGDVSGITIRDFNLVGNDPTPGTFQSAQAEAGLEIEGVTNADISGLTISAVYGDGWKIGLGSTGVVVHDNHVISAGRNGTSVISASNVTVRNNAFDTIGYVTFDLEPNQTTEGSSFIHFENNTAGTWGQEFFALDGSHTGADIHDVFVSGNTITGRSLLTFVDNGGTARDRNISFTNNTSSVSAAGPVLHFSHVDGLIVTGNVQPLSSGVLASFTDCTGVTYP